MAWLPIHAGQDHLQQFTRRAPIDALAELIWNGLDAEADTVDVDTETSSGCDEDPCRILNERRAGDRAVGSAR